MQFSQDIYLVFMQCMYHSMNKHLLPTFSKMHLQIEFWPIVGSTILKFMTLAAIFHPQRWSSYPWWASISWRYWVVCKASKAHVCVLCTHWDYGTSRSHENRTRWEARLGKTAMMKEKLLYCVHLDLELWSACNI